MLANFHTHTSFSDGKNTPEELVKYAIGQGFTALGFSDHSFTPHDTRYCMRDTQGYIKEITRLKKEYRGETQIYLGIEEDATAPINRAEFDYIIGSLHYINYGGKFYPLDSNYEYFSACLRLFDGDDLALAECYFEYFCQYLEKRKPDIIGHFDLLTKFDETQKSIFLTEEKYWGLAEKFLLRAIKTNRFFEVNTAMIIRGLRSSPYPHERLLATIAKHGGGVVLSSDAHQAENLCAYFEEVKTLLKKVGFDGAYALYDGKWQKYKI